MSLSAINLTAFRSTVFIGLGSNLSEPARQLREALQEIDELPETALIKVSSFYESAPIGLANQSMFVNAVAQVETTQSPQQLMAQLLGIESRHQRVRAEKNGPRTLDLDILIFNEWRIDEPDLVTPHPRAHERAFVLYPLIEIAPELYIPGKGLAKTFLSGVVNQVIHKIDEYHSQTSASTT